MLAERDAEAASIQSLVSVAVQSAAFAPEHLDALALAELALAERLEVDDERVLLEALVRVAAARDAARDFRSAAVADARGDICHAFNLGDGRGQLRRVLVPRLGRVRLGAEFTAVAGLTLVRRPDRAEPRRLVAVVAVRKDRAVQSAGERFQVGERRRRRKLGILLLGKDATHR